MQALHVLGVVSVVVLIGAIVAGLEELGAGRSIKPYAITAAIAAALVATMFIAAHLSA